MASSKRTVPAPKPIDVAAAIPRIVLDDRGGASDPSPNPVKPTSISTRTTTTITTTATTNGPGVTMTSAVVDTKESPDGVEYIPHRCNSDIGLPTASMPNLTLAMTLGEEGGGGGGRGKLGVYCSPRTTRRSVDLDVSSRNREAHEDYDWLEDRTSSLHVLTAGSRVGSALSLNSVCTAHSVGLLSNDSDDDFQDISINDGSVSEGMQGSERSAGAQLRRLQSYPEEDHTAVNDAAVTPRTSHSLCNLQAAQAGPSTPAEHRGPAQAQDAELTPEKLCLLPSDLDECRDRRVLPPGPVDGRDKREGRGGARQKAGSRDEGGRKVHMVSYVTNSNAMREGRIRRWLEDMDKTS